MIVVSATDEQEKILRELGRVPVLGDIEVPASGPSYWRSVWSTRHTATMGVVAVLLHILLAGAVSVMGMPGMLLLALAALVGGFTVATCVPPVGVPARVHMTDGSCALMPLAIIVAAPFLISDAPSSQWMAAAVLVFYGAAAARRALSHAAC